MTATVEMPALENSRPAGRESVKVDASGTRLRLRALAALGHSDTRIARALGRPVWVVTKILTCQVREVSPELHADVCRLFAAWWDKTPPTRTRAEARAAAAARTRARRGRWCTPLALDEDEVDTPGYKPRTGWLPATGTGVAGDDPLGRAS